MKENHILENLNKSQKEAVLAPNGPLLIVAGAGSGKTRALTHKIGYLMSSGVLAHNIVALTFTNKAAEQMGERVTELLGPNASSTHTLPFMGTFHSFGSRILRKNINMLGYDNNFLIYDEKDRMTLIKDITSASQSIPENIKPGAIKAAISNHKNELISPQQYSNIANSFFENIVAEVYIKYTNTLKELNALDFDDLLLLPVELFNKFPEVLSNYQNKITHILVDEYQDTNKAQYIFLKQLAGEKKNICVVGDDWQAIYGFRGADFRNIFNFEKDYPGTKVIFLEQNYRSTKNILHAAGSIIEKNSLRTDKKLWTDKERGSLINIVGLSTETGEAFFIIKQIEKLIRDKEINSLKEVVILYRTNAQSRVLEEAFLASGIAYKIVGSVRFYERREIKDIVAYLRLIYNQKDILSLKRVINTPPRGIGKVSLDKILSGEVNKKADLFLKMIDSLRKNPEKHQLSGLIEDIIKKISYKKYINDGTVEGESRWENIKEFIGVAKKFDKMPIKDALKDFLEEIALLSPNDDISNKDNVVNLMTLHSVKGLEFPIVFIAGCEEGLLPHSRSILSPKEMEEERRLCYVGATRAKKKIYFLYTKQRSIFGVVQKNIPSRFLGDIPEDIVEFSEPSEEDLNSIEI